MNHATPTTSPPPGEFPTGPRTPISRMVDGVYLVALVVVLARTCFTIPALEHTGWPEAMLVFAATAAAMLGLARQVPAQNVWLASFLIAAIGGAAHAINALTGVPFGPGNYTAAGGPRLFGLIPWPMPLIWIVAILSSRGVSRLILKPWRRTHRYGYRVIGCTVLLSTVLDFGFELFGAKIERLWIREPMRFGIDWYGTPPTNFLAWAVIALLILAFATPSMIRKSPTKTPADYQPLVVWLGLNLLFASGAAAHQLWTAAAVIAAMAGVTAIFAVRGARW